jgi:hypothetical protein
VGLVLLAFTPACLNFDQSNDNSYYSSIVCVLTGILCLLAPSIGVWRTFKNHPDWLEAQITISANGLVSKGAASGFENNLPWSSFKKIQKWRNALILIISSDRALFIPFRCFPSAQSAENFCHLAQEYWQQANTNQITKK